MFWLEQLWADIEASFWAFIKSLAPIIEPLNRLYVLPKPIVRVIQQPRWSQLRWKAKT